MQRDVCQTADGETIVAATSCLKFDFFKRLIVDRVDFERPATDCPTARDSTGG